MSGEDEAGDAQTVRDLLRKYERNLEDSDPPQAMIDACDEFLEEMEEEDGSK